MILSYVKILYDKFLLLAQLQIISGLINSAVLIGGELKLTCLIEGVPAPDIIWIMNGQQQRRGVNNSLLTETGVRSMFVISEVTTGHAGLVTCVALHNRNGIIYTISSTANIIILSKNYFVNVEYKWVDT